ncbi:hypothetical protein ABK040_009228 [Willaertia magna]
MLQNKVEKEEPSFFPSNTQGLANEKQQYCNSEKLEKLINNSTKQEEKKKKLICVLGSTSVGKSSLALHIGNYLNQLNKEEKKITNCNGSVIINSDVMQMYEGLPISTNKPTEKELELIHHYFIGTKNGLLDKSKLYTVLDFQVDCHNLLEEELFPNRLIPIIVGGTNYYIQSIVFEDYLIGEIEENNREQYVEINEKDNEIYTHERLKEIDPESAEKIHPNDIRKIKKRILLFERTNKVFSKQVKEKENLQKQLKYDCIFIYIGCDDKELLRNRIIERANQMMEQGLLEEVIDFHNYLKEQNILNPSLEHGILQSIGYKEFLPYLKELDNNSNNKEVLEKLKKQCLETLITATYRYARKQETWYRSLWASNKIPLMEKGILYSFDISKENINIIKENAIKLINCFIKDEIISEDLLNKYQVRESPKKKEEEIFTCETCKSTHQGQEKFKRHMNSKAHKKRKKKEEEEEERKKFIKKEEDNNNENSTEENPFQFFELE